MKMIICKFFISTVVSVNSLSSLFGSERIGSIQNSIIPTIEYFESIENLPSQKFTKKQLEEINKALDKKEEKIRLVTYNMLFNLYDHNLEEENRWLNRLPRIVELIQAINPDIICTQELYPTQVQDIEDLLNNEFAFFSGCVDPDGESYGIFYKKNRFEVQSSQVETPLSILQLKDVKTDKTISVFNTHLAFSNIEKREVEAHKIVQLIKPYAKDGAVIFTGDLNTFPARLDLTGLPFYDGDYLHRILSTAAIKNAESCSLIGHFGPISTFTNSGTGITPFQGTGTPGVVLDYIYASDKVIILTHATEPGTIDGHFPSDHMPVIIDFIID